MTVELIWEEPPNQEPRGKYAAYAKALKAKPGKNLRILTNSTTGSSVASQINNGRIAAFAPKGAFTATAIRVDNVDGKRAHNVYVKYNKTQKKR